MYYYYITSVHENSITEFKNITRGNNKNDCTYLELYLENIVPRLQSIDLKLKSGACEFKVSEVCELLEISEAKVQEQLRQLNITVITPDVFLTIMQGADSEIGKMYAREIECHSPITYTAENIAYIYQLDLNLVKKSFEKLNAKEITSYMLPSIFSNIHIGY